MALNQRPWRTRRWLILAPHPDDETLGAGALIAQASATGTLAAVVYLTDGSGSHDIGDGRFRKLICTRRREAALALSRLTGGRRLTRMHLCWKDAHPAALGSAQFDQSATRIAALCRRERVDAIGVTAMHEPHCDHAAAAELAYAVKSKAKRTIVVAEYCVWGSCPRASDVRQLRTISLLPGTRKHALRAHRSQLTQAYGSGFRLAAENQRMASFDTLFVRRSR